MIALIIIGIIILIIAIILSLRCFVTVEYSDDIYLKFRLLFWVVDLFEEDNVTVRTKSLTKKQAVRFEQRLAKERAKDKTKQKPKKRPQNSKARENEQEPPKLKPISFCIYNRLKLKGSVNHNEKTYKHRINLNNLVV